MPVAVDADMRLTAWKLVKYWCQWGVVMVFNVLLRSLKLTLAFQLLSVDMYFHPPQKSFMYHLGT